VILAGIPAVAGAAAIGAAVEVKSGGGPAHLTAPAAASVRAAVLDAFDRSSGDIIQITQTGGPLGLEAAPTAKGSMRAWIYPMLAKPGQEVRSRFVTSVAGRTVRDAEWDYIKARRRGGLIVVNYGDRTWFRGDNGEIVYFPPIGATTASVIRDNIASGLIKVAGEATVRGIRVIKLTFSSGFVSYDEATLYVDARTYLPVEYIASGRGPKGQVNQVRFALQVLPATPVNLARLTTPVPAGFTRTTKPPIILSPWIS